MVDSFAPYPGAGYYAPGPLLGRESSAIDPQVPRTACKSYPDNL